MRKATLFKSIRSFCQPHQLFLRIIGAGLCLILTIYSLFRSDPIWAILSFNLAIQCAFFGLIPKKQHEPYLTTDIFSQLKCDQDIVYIRDRQLPIHQVKKVALDQFDKDYALIDFPFNIYRAAAVRFPLSQLPQIQCWLQQHLPDAEIIR